MSALRKVNAGPVLHIILHLIRFEIAPVANYRAEVESQIAPEPDVCATARPFGTRYPRAAVLHSKPNLDGKEFYMPIPEREKTPKV